MTKKLPEKYNIKETESKWRNNWHKNNIYRWNNDLSRQETFVIDTPPPTVSGLLHMGHVFSYTQADFVARYKRMQGKDVFYPMGFDDNGLPTERLVEKIIGQKAMVFEAQEREKNHGGSGYFVAKCREVVKEAEEEFEALFNEIALSVDWSQKYQTISTESQKISQASFLDLYQKGLVEKRFSPVFWDIADRTALAKADIIDKEIEGEMYFINFTLDGKKRELEIMTTRPELLPACVAVMINSKDERYKNLILKTLNNQGEGETGSFAITPIFKVKVPIIADNSVQIDKGTGAVMCCTYGDETDLEWQRKYDLPIREIICTDGKLAKLETSESSSNNEFNEQLDENIGLIRREDSILLYSLKDEFININPKKFLENYQNIAKKNIKDAKKIIVELLSKSVMSNSSFEEESLLPNYDLDLQNKFTSLIKSQKITRPVKCAERSGVPIEIISTAQWFIKILPFKEQLKNKARKCNWYPNYMRIRIEQWIDGLSWDWCISRQRFFGVKIPVWNLRNVDPERSVQSRWGENYEYKPELYSKPIIPNINNLPIDPLVNIPEDCTELNAQEKENLILKLQKKYSSIDINDKEKRIIKDKHNEYWFLEAETDVLDTWATSSITPQLSSKGISSEICFDESRHQKLFPADMRPQAHEIIRTWAFYTIVKAYLHSLEIVKDKNDQPQKNQDGSIKLQENPNSKQTIPWHNLMISGWCLASDKTKMSKSKGNVITPKSLIEEKSSDVVRYWASASSLGADIAYSEEVFKIGQKLITKIFNSAKFCSQHFLVLENYCLDEFGSKNLQDEDLVQLISHSTDLWILSRLEIVIEEYNKQFAIYEYAKAREVLEEFFWHYFCDNYLEICKVRSYGLSAEKLVGLNLNKEQTQQILQKQLSTLATLNLCLKNILKLFAPFIPHITEEIYSIIYHDEFLIKKSIHARGNCAKLPKNLNLLLPNILEIGDEILKILFEVRKYKSEKNLSMKTPISSLNIGCKHDLNPFLDDLLNVCNAVEININHDNIGQIKFNII